MMDIERNENGVPQYPKGHVGRLLVTLAAISALERPTAASVSTHTGLSKSKITDYVTALGSQLGVSIVKHGSEYQIVSYGDLLNEAGTAKLLKEPINGTASIKLDISIPESESLDPYVSTLHPLTTHARGQTLLLSRFLEIESLGGAYLDYVLAHVERPRFEEVQLIFNGGLKAEYVQVKEPGGTFRYWSPSREPRDAAEVLSVDPSELAKTGWIDRLRKLAISDHPEGKACVPIVIYEYERDQWPDAF